MPKVAITGTIISTVWDDDSKTDIQLDSGTFDDTGEYVSINDDGHSVYIRRDAWPVIKEQIDGLFEEMSDE